MLAAALVSCNKEGADGMGYLKLKIDKDESLVVIGTKAEADPVFQVKIFDADSNEAASYDNHNDLVENPLKLKVGKYSIVASTGENGGHAAFNMPVYQGEDKIEIVKGLTTTAQVVCKLSQVKVTVKCDDKVTDGFSKVRVTVTNNTDFSDQTRNLVYDIADGVAEDGTVGQAGYFQCSGTLQYTVYLENNDGEVSEGDIFGTFKNVKPQEHYILNLSMTEDDLGSALRPGITLDPSTNDKEINVGVIVNKKAKPAFTANGFDLDGVSYVSEGSTLSWQVNVTARAGISYLKVAHSSAVLSNLGIPYSFDVVSVDGSGKNAVNGAGLVWSGVAAGTKQMMTLDFSSLMSVLPVGDYSFTFTAYDRQDQMVVQNFAFTVIPAVEVSAVSADPWGRHAFIHGRYNTAEQPSGMGFEYKKSGDESWTRVDQELTISGNSYSVKLSGLDSRTKYVFRAVSESDSSNEIEFTTLGVDQITNMSFDSWYKDSKTWYPNASSSDFWWDSGNKGANTLNEVNPTQPSSDVAVAGDGKQSALLKSSTAAGQFAAGSLFLGQFVKATLSPMGATLNWGRPYSCKPLSLKGYYNYSPVIIDKAKSPHLDKQGTMDICQVYVVLADWPEGTFEVSTGDSKFIQIDTDPNIIAYGSLESNEATNGWKPFEITINYRNNRVPTTCVIVCSSSKYGDYFTGGIGSTLLVDEFEFVF